MARDDSGPHESGRRSSGSNHEIARLARSVDGWSKSVQKDALARSEEKRERELAEQARTYEVDTKFSDINRDIGDIDKRVGAVEKDIEDLNAVPAPITGPNSTAPIHIPQDGVSTELLNEQARAKTGMFRGINLVLAALAAAFSAYVTHLLQ